MADNALGSKHGAGAEEAQDLIERCRWTVLPADGGWIVRAADGAELAQSAKGLREALRLALAEQAKRP